jgi:hypothetical protein
MSQSRVFPKSRAVDFADIIATTAPLPAFH